MPKRNRKHRLEDESRYKFSLILPEEWLFRNKDKDYGIDGEVEIFEDEVATGLLFFVQLKATDSKNDLVILNYDYKIDTIIYYQRLDVPVLLARYSSVKDKFYYKWNHEIDLFKIKKNSKTFRVKFDPNNLLNANEFSLILNNLRKQKKIRNGSVSLPIYSHLEILDRNIKNISNVVLKTKITNLLKEYKSVVKLSERNNAFANISITSKKLKIHLIGYPGCIFQNINKRKDSSFISNIVKDIVLGLAVSLIQVGLRDLGIRIVFESKLESRLMETRELLFNLLPILLESAYFKETFYLIDKLIEEDYKDIIGPLTQASVLINSGGLNKERLATFENFLKKRFQQAIKNNDLLSAGMYSYNLGNHYRSINKLRKSVEYYFKAKKLAPIYLNQHYFFSELGGVLFLLNKFRFSSRLYKISIDCGAPDDINALYADALMFSGYYLKARDVFNNYLNLPNSQKDAEWSLKMISLESLIDDYGINEQHRKIERAIKLADLTKITSTDTKLKKLKSALELDLLCGLAWFNMGVLYSQQKNQEEATFCFSMCGLIQSHDIESWVNATLSSFNKDTPIQIGALIISTAYFKNSEDYLEELYKKLSEQKDPKIIELVSSAVEMIVPKNNAKKMPEFRILQGNGIFKNIFIN